MTSTGLRAWSPGQSPLQKTPGTLLHCRNARHVYYIGPTLNQHWLNDFSRWRSKSCPANTEHSHRAVSMLAHRLRRWPNIETTLGVCWVVLIRAQTGITFPQTAVTVYFCSRPTQLLLFAFAWQHIGGDN